MAVTKLSSLVKMANLTLCPWGTKSKKTAILAQMEQCFTEERTRKQRQAVFQVHQCMHQWTQQCTIHSPMAKVSTVFLFYFSEIGVKLFEIRRLERLPTEYQVNKIGYRYCIDVVFS